MKTYSLAAAIATAMLHGIVLGLVVPAGIYVVTETFTAVPSPVFWVALSCTIASVGLGVLLYRKDRNA